MPTAQKMSATTASGSDMRTTTTVVSNAEESASLPPPLIPSTKAPHPHRVSFMHRLSSSFLSDSSSSRHSRSRSTSHHGAAGPPRSATPTSDKATKFPRRPISVRRTSSIFSVKAINDEMDEFERAEEEEEERLASSRAGSALSHISAITAAEGLEEEEIESGNQQKQKQKQPPLRRASTTDSDSVAFDDGERIGRFFVTKRKGMTIAPIASSATAGKDTTPAPTPTAAAPVAADSHSAPLVVVLFGWLTCQDKHLHKYAELYHRIGCEVVLRHTVPARKVLRRKQRGVVRAGAELIAEIPRYFPNAKVVIHYFSNGGCFVHRRILLLLNGHYDDSPKERKHLTEEQRQLHQQLLKQRATSSYVTCIAKEATTVSGSGGNSHGASTITSSSSACSSTSSANTSSCIYKFPQLHSTIFDSCPAAADAVTAARAMSAALRGPIARFVMFSTIYSGLQVYGAAQAWQFEKKWLQDIEEDPLPVPSLYIYSEDDQITDPAVVENVMDARRETLVAAGRLKAAEGIEGWKVPTPSAHVCHYTKHSEEYKRRLKDFLVNKGLMVPQQQHGQQQS